MYFSVCLISELNKCVCFFSGLYRSHVPREQGIPNTEIIYQNLMMYYYYYFFNLKSLKQSKQQN